MFSVSEEEAAAIRAVYEQRGELSAAVELRRRFPGILDNVQARECARIIAGWKPLLKRPLRRGKRPPAPDALRRINSFPGSARRGCRCRWPSGQWHGHRTPAQQADEAWAFLVAQEIVTVDGDTVMLHPRFAAP